MQVLEQRESFKVIFIFFLPKSFTVNKEIISFDEVEENISALLLFCIHKLTSSADDAIFFSANGSVLLSLIMSLPEEPCLRYFLQQYLGARRNERKYNLIISNFHFLLRKIKRGKSRVRAERKEGKQNGN